ncbi:MAG: DUF5916 domain-containing protein [Acidobacteriota bacterium]
MRAKKFLLPALGFWLCVLPAFSEGTKGIKVGKGAAESFTLNIPEFPSPPKIDGVVENPFWEKGAVVERFTQFEPLEGGTPSERTKVYIAYDKNNLYLAFRCFDSDPGAVRACLTQRDKAQQDDGVTVYLDTFNDKKRAFVFQVNPCGVQTDGIFSESIGRRRAGGWERFDRSWDTYFQADARLDGQGYTVEMAIPFKSLRFPHADSQQWGIKIVRSIPRKNEEIYWPPHTRDVNGFLVQSGKIEFHGSIEKGKNIEIMPVATGLRQSGKKFDPQAGLNLKWGVTSDMTLDSTLNPDFSQVEADIPQVAVNQRYALYYPEKRPFFLEGKDYFDTPFELVYTRKIVDPQGGVKLTGKTKGFTIGVLSILDSNSPELDINDSLEDEESEGEPEISYQALVNIFRLKKDLASESYIGLIVTDKEEGISSGSLTSNYNRVAGLDGHFKFLNYNRFGFQAVGAVTKWGGRKPTLSPPTPSTSVTIPDTSRSLPITPASRPTLRPALVFSGGRMSGHSTPAPGTPFFLRTTSSSPFGPRSNTEEFTISRER